ncbi:MAG: sugar nucleotide-binding protein [Caulobacteraceae bacterium]|nr:sugar nucleotide-binding protein [Caulobacter sp.]
MAGVGAALELWGGPECTVNRVHDRWFDQTVRTGHEHRLDDLDRFASLGLKAIRYPVLWERVAPDRPENRDWRWSDARLMRLRELGLPPIVGLVHHGSGPRYTDLLDDGFAPGLAAHARAVVERYPWVEAWTPVNEPLTTARFAGLYGLWHPHGRDEAAFLRCLLTQVEATAAAMAAVRAVNPAARLVQTEDLGHVFATDPLAHQAAYENERRWLSFDLLCGRVDRDHALWRAFEAAGLADRVRRLADAPCPPDVVGLNHYLSSERFLDHRLELYPPHLHGGNGRERYADVEAVRAVMPGVMGLERLLLAAHDRYGLPLAVTESHNVSTRDEQLRWLLQGWRACETARSQGADVRAFTVWSLMGAVDWPSLLTRDEHRYEPGVWDVRAEGAPRETALAAACRRLARGEAAPPPAAEGPAWWERDLRLSHPPTWAGQSAPVRRAWSPPAGARRPVLLLGAGAMAESFARALEHRGHAYAFATAAAAAADELAAADPWAVVDLRGLSGEAVDIGAVAQACAGRGAPFAALAGSAVFDGRDPAPRRETDQATQADEAARRQLATEAAVTAAGGLVIRTSAVFSALGEPGFAGRVAAALGRGRVFRAAADLWISPTSALDLADAALDLLIDDERGVAHLANAGAATWAQFAVRLAEALELDGGLIEAPPAAMLSSAPVAAAPLASRLGELLPPWEDAVARYAAAVRPRLNIAPARRRAAEG